MWTRKLLKENAKVAFKRNYWICVIVSLIAMVLGAGSSGSRTEFDFDSESTNSGFESIYSDDMMYGESDLIEEATDIIYSVVSSPIFIITVVIVSLLAIMLAILVTNVVAVGHKRFYMENREHKTAVGQLFYAFREERYGSTVWTMFCMDLYLFGWSLLFIIPGIIKSYSYMMIPYILADNPEISKDRAFEISRSMMDGHKWDAFVLGLSFIGWQIVSTISFGLAGIFWVNPYMDATYAEFYAAIKAEAFQRGITSAVELPGFSYPEYAEQF